MARLKISVSPSLSRLDLVIKGLTNSRYMGNYPSVFKGQGIEFADFRAYMPDDDASRIDWKTSARAGKLVVKEYIEERNLDVLFLVDVSSKMMLGSTGKLKAEYVADFVASLAHTILRAGDKVGLTLFSDKIRKIVYPDLGMKHFYFISDVLSNLDYYGGGCDIKKAVDFALDSLNNGDVVFLVSDFIFENNFENLLAIAGQKYDFIAVVVRDPLDLELPSVRGEVVVEEPVHGEKLIINPKKIAKYYSLESRDQLNKLKKDLGKAEISVLELNTKDSFIAKLLEFFSSRRRLWR